ncbi:hypothetical protein [Costertonia aggregata]|uniref:Uncharacterized protein n=1 Tax=Costertonia aggregata TaxID=343403 RepID=A0A7H9ANB0_9FLAO|nr:hypothetical protein [Costertonia aggregata]QLG44941.1 hypothetical protein HYG79_06095 [Costertonia aggregata]
MAKKKENPFKKLEESIKEVPPHMKKKVMNDVATAKLIMELASLFTINVKSLIAGMFKTNPNVE